MRAAKWPYDRRVDVAHAWGVVAVGTVGIATIAGVLATLHATDSHFRWWWPTNWMIVPVAIFLVGLVLAVLPVRRSEDEAHEGTLTPVVAHAEPSASPPAPANIEEAIELGKRCAKVSKAIYAFLNREAGRSDEPKVVAEYRQKFDARVHNLCLDLLAGGLSDIERLKNVERPAASVDDIQWIARGLSSYGDGYSAERLAKYQAQATKELSARGTDHDQETETDSPDRVFVHRTPRELVGLFKRDTSIQAQKQADAFYGKWLKVSGRLGDVGEWSGYHSQVTFAFTAFSSVTVFMIFRDRAYVENRLSVLKKWDRVTVQGKIERIDILSVQLTNCELVDG